MKPGMQDTTEVRWNKSSMLAINCYVWINVHVMSLDCFHLSGVNASSPTNSHEGEFKVANAVFNGVHRMCAWYSLLLFYFI